MCGGKPPPAKLYIQPPAPTSATLAIKTPNRRIELRHLIHSRDRQPQRSPRTRIVVANMRRIGALDPLCYPTAVDAFCANQRIAMKSEPPGGRPPDVCSQCIPLDTNDGIGKIWQRDPPENRPKEGRGRDEPPGQVASRGAKRIAQQNGGSGSEASGQVKIQPGAVWRRHPGHPVSAPAQIPVVELPRKDNFVVSGREGCVR